MTSSTTSDTGRRKSIELADTMLNLMETDDSGSEKGEDEMDAETKGTLLRFMRTSVAGLEAELEMQQKQLPLEDVLGNSQGGSSATNATGIVGAIAPKRRRSIVENLIEALPDRPSNDGVRKKPTAARIAGEDFSSIGLPSDNYRCSDTDNDNPDLEKPVREASAKYQGIGSQRPVTSSSDICSSTVLDPELAKRIGQKGPGGFMKLQDKVCFIASVVNLLLIQSLLLSCNHVFLMCWYYVITFVPLMLYRLVSYRRDKMAYFLLDFCYFANVVLLVYLFILPSEAWIFDIAFACATGPLIASVMLFRNSLVFHSIDKMTSFFIHVLPFWVCYAVRFRLEDVVGGAKHFPFTVLQAPFENLKITRSDEVGLLHTVLYPMAFVMAHQILWVMATYGPLCPIPEGHLNLFRYLKDGKHKALYRKLPGGQRYVLSWYLVINVLTMPVFFLPVILQYKFEAVMVIYGGVMMLLGIWNGANFYVEVFARKYLKDLEKRAEKKLARPKPGMVSDKTS